MRLKFSLKSLACSEMVLFTAMLLVNNVSRQTCWKRKLPSKRNDASRWRHQMETFSALLTLCVGNSLATGEFPSQRPVTRDFDVLFDLRLNKRLSKQSRGWWFGTPSRSLWRHCNVNLSGAEFSWENLKISLHFLLLLCFDIVTEILSHRQWGLGYSVQTMAWLLMSWRRKDVM